jgi:hypothetical protein
MQNRETLQGRFPVLHRPSGGFVGYIKKGLAPPIPVIGPTKTRLPLNRAADLP